MIRRSWLRATRLLCWKPVDVFDKSRSQLGRRRESNPRHRIL